MMVGGVCLDVWRYGVEKKTEPQGTKGTIATTTITKTLTTSAEKRIT